MLYQLSYLAQKKARAVGGAGGSTFERDQAQLYRGATPTRVPGLDQVSAKSQAGTRFVVKAIDQVVTGGCFSIADPFRVPWPSAAGRPQR